MDDRDPLTRVLGDFGMTGVFYSMSRLGAPWGIDLPPMPRLLVFHLLTEGSAIVEVEGTRHHLTAGELMLVPHGTGHVIRSDTDAPAIGLWDVPRLVETDRYEVLEIDGGGERARLVCGAVTFSGPALSRLLAGLPPVLVVGREADRAWLRACVDVIAAEAHEARSGSDIVTARLADVLLVHAIRDWVTEENPDTGWLAALRDDHVGAALRAFHDEPGKPWTLTALAAEARQSRSGFAARFAELVGEPPIAYVTAWRMDLAARMLGEEDVTVATVARRVGYESEPAFNRAFRRHHGETPGAWRKGDREDRLLAAAGMPAPPREGLASF